MTLPRKSTISSALMHSSYQNRPPLQRKKNVQKKERKHAYKRQLWNHHRADREAIDSKISQVVVRVVRAQQEQRNGHEQQELLGRGVLVAVVYLLPHVEVVVGARVEVEGHALHVVEHQVAAGHVGDVGQRPGGLLRHAG